MSIYTYQHGVKAQNVGQNILSGMSTASNLKTAQMRRDKRQREVDVEDAGVELRENALIENDNALIEQSNALVDESEQGGEDGEFLQEKKETLSKEKKNALSALNPDALNKIKEEKRAGEVRKYKSKHYQSMGMSIEDADAKAILNEKELKSFSDEVKNMTNAQIEIETKLNSHVANEIFSISSFNPIGEDGKPIMQEDGVTPITKESMYQAKLKELSDDMIDAINEKDSVTYNKLKKIKNSMPSKFGDGNWVPDYFANAETKQKIIESTVTENAKHLKKQPKVVTHGNEDVLLTPTKKGWSKDKKTSNALLKQESVNDGKSGSGSIKTSDFSLVEKIAIRNTTGLNLDNPDDLAKFAELSQEQRDTYTDLSARASRIYKDGGGKITHAEAVKKAAKEKSRGKTPVEGKLYKKNGATYKIVGGKPVKQ